MADPTAAVAMDVLSGERSAGVVNEKQLFEFLAEVKASTIANSTSAQYANPAAMGGELFRSMGGYLKQTAKVQEMLNGSKELRVANVDGGTETADAKAALHAGPAKEQLTASGKTEGGAQKTSMATIEELSVLADRYMEVMKFSVVTSVVTGGASITGHAITSLTKGQ